MLEIRPLDEDLLEETRLMCNRVMEFDQLPAEWFRYKTLGDPDFDPAMTLIAVDSDKVRGAMMGVCRAGSDSVTGGIKFFVVDEESRNRGIASELLKRVEAVAAERGAGSLTVGFTRPNYITAGLDPRYTTAVAFLLRRGFERRAETFNMDVDLTASDWSTTDLEVRLADQGITCRRISHDEFSALDDYLIKAGHSTGWRYQIAHAATQEPPGVFVAEKDGEVIAFACYDGVRPGWFGPMGTSPTLRGSGIGTLTFLKCLQSMKKVGYTTCVINCVGPLYFYSKVANARVSRVFWQFEKSLATPS